MLNRKIKALEEEFRRGIARALGVSVEDIDPRITEKWVREWARAFLTPEAFRRVFGHNSPTKIEQSTFELMTHLATRYGAQETGVGIQKRRRRGI